jgi:hypothetical protein
VHVHLPPGHGCLGSSHRLGRPLAPLALVAASIFKIPAPSAGQLRYLACLLCSLCNLILHIPTIWGRIIDRPRRALEREVGAISGRRYLVPCELQILNWLERSKLGFQTATPISPLHQPWRPGMFLVNSYKQHHDITY